MLRGVPDIIEAYGESLRPFAMPVKTWIGDGFRVTFEAAGPDFWTPIYQLVTRNISRDKTRDELLVPEEGIDRVTALKMATTWASEYMLAEDTIGTLEPGKYADLIVLGKDFFTMPIEEIRDGVPVVLTMLSGRVVWDQM